MPPAFRLEKWYLDCVTDGGEAWVGYAAVLGVGKLKVRAASLLRCDAAGAVSQRNRLRGVPLPTVEGSTVRWGVPGLGFDGEWTGRAAGFERELLDPGEVSWCCVQSASDVAVRIGGERLRGEGYVERLTLTLPPWRLPIDELRWGRAVAFGRSVVWLDWVGPKSMRLVYLDGRPAARPCVSDREVTAEGVRVKLDEQATLRAGSVEKTVFRRVPGVTRLLARHRLALDETKWLSRASMEFGPSRSSGWAIHEVVRWG